MATNPFKFAHLLCETTKVHSSLQLGRCSDCSKFSYNNRSINYSRLVYSWKLSSLSRRKVQVRICLTTDPVSAGVVKEVLHSPS